jgi:acyl carrier protein
MTANEEIRQQVIAVIAEEFELDPAKLTPEATLYDDLGLDSLDAVDLVVALEKAFAIKLANEEAVRSVRTMADLFQLISTTRGGV